jgi:energy-coupling factor transporter ATP-binding protein EcfA2
LAPPSIAFRNYTFTYAGSQTPAVREISLEIERGELILLVGHSGCGKSTLLRSVIGLIPHMYSGEVEGEVWVEGLRVAETPISRLATKVGYVFQNPENQIFMFTVERDVAFGLENLGLPREEIRERVDWALDLLKIRELAHKAPHELSDGQKQRVALAGVLAMRPSILILDEPTSLLDPYTALELAHLVRHLHDELGITVVVVEHRLDLLAPIVSRIIVMSQGRVVVDAPPREVLSQREVEAYGVGIPAVARLHTLLKAEGRLEGPTPLTVEEFVKELKGCLG